MAKIIVVYDDNCLFCNRNKNILEKIDFSRRLQWVGISKINLKEHNLRQKDVFEEMHLIDNGKVYRGYFAFKKISSKIPLLYGFYLVSLIPGIDFFGNKVYKFVAKRRHKQLDLSIITF